MKNITIAGELGSGKTTVSNYLITKIDYKIVSAGMIFRNMAMKHNMSAKEFNEFIENDPHYDNYVDDTIADMGKNENNIIFDSRMAWYFVPDSFKIYLYVDVNIAAERILNDKKRINESYNDFASAKQNIIDRRKSEVLRYSNFYHVDVNDYRHYDLIIDTGSADKQDINELVLKSFQAYCNGREYDKIWLSPKSLNLIENNCDDENKTLKVIKYNNCFYVFEGKNIVKNAIKEHRTLLSVNTLYQENDILPLGITAKEFIMKNK